MSEYLVEIILNLFLLEMALFFSLLNFMFVFFQNIIR